MKENQKLKIILDYDASLSYMGPCLKTKLVCPISIQKTLLLQAHLHEMFQKAGVFFIV